MRKRKLLLILVLLSAVEGFAADKWSGVRSKNFNVVGNATEAQIKTVAEDLEQFRLALSEVFVSATKPSSVPTTVIVFKNDESYRPFKPVVDNNSATVTGYFQLSEELNYMAVVTGLPAPRSAYHDYIHQVIRDLPASVPLWFAEGAAEFYSTFQLSNKDKKLTLGEMIKDHTDLLRKEKLLPFDELFAVDRTSPQYSERSRRGIFYAESWALVNYLVMGVGGTRQLQLVRFLELLAEKKPIEESFKTAFESDYNKIQSELQSYIRERSSWPNLPLALKDKNEIDKDIKAHPVTDAEAEYYLGDLMLHMNRLADAEVHLKQAVTVDPKLGIAQAAMGMLQFRRDDFPEALKYLKQAVTLDPKNYLVHYYYASALDKSSTTALDDLDAKRGALGKVIELAPQFMPAYEMMAYLNLTADLDYNGTLELLQKARTLAPSNLNLPFLMAQVYVKKEDFDAAEKLLDLLTNSNAAEPALQDGISNLKNYIARFREAENKRGEPEPDPTPARREEVKPVEKELTPVPKDPSPPPPPPRSSGRSGELVLDSPQPVRPTGTRVTGVLTLIDCTKGMTLTIKTATETIKLHSDNPSKIQFVSFVKTVSATITCGPVSGPGTPVAITYRPTPEGPAAGEPLVVEFVEK